MKERTQEIHNDLIKLARTQREALAVMLERLTELNQRKGFLEFGHSSLMKYCVKELGLSESAAYRRIKALRIVERAPEIKEKLEQGSLNLSQISKAAEVFQEYSQEKGHSVPDFRKIELLEQVEKKGGHESENAIRKGLDLPPKERRITITVSEETYNKWIEYKGVMAHKNMSPEMLLRFAIEKASCVEMPKRKYARRAHDPNSRYIPAHMKRELLRKSGFKCSWPGCNSSYALEIDHIKEFSKGGKTELSNLRVLCRNHNQARNFT